MITIQDMQKHIARFSYFPGWKMEIKEGFAEGPHFHAWGEVEDSTSPGEKVLLDIHSPIPPQISLESLSLWIHWRLTRAWIHESMEWLKVDGKPLYDPHRPYADRDEYDFLSE